MIDRHYLSLDRARWAARLVPTYPSVVLYAQVDRAVIPKDTQPVEMLVGNPDRLDDGSTDQTARITTESGARLMTPAQKPAGWGIIGERRI